MTSVTLQSRVMLAVEDCSRNLAIRAGVASADSGIALVSSRRSRSTSSLLSIPRRGRDSRLPKSYQSGEPLPNNFRLMHRFLSQIARILQVNRLMEVAHVIEGALESWDRHRADRQRALSH